MTATKSLSELKAGDRAVICAFREDVAHDPTLSRRLMEMGLTLGAAIEVAHEAPFGGALAVRCRGSLIALRLADAAIVEVRAMEGAHEH